MGSEIEVKLPIIDFSNIVSIESNTNSNWKIVKSKVQKALEEYGCFEAIFDKVPLELRKAFFDELEELFNLPLETKKLVVSSKPYRGYVGPYDLYESMGIDDVDVSHNVQHLTTTLWPQGKPNFRKCVESFTEQVIRLDEVIRRMILESLGVEKYLEEHVNSTNYYARLMKYKGPQTKEAKTGLPEHTDKNILTILCQNQIDGLEVQTKTGEWIRCKPSSSFSFFPIVGDALYAWTNGRVHVPYHRVIVSGNETRLCVGLFTVTKEGYIVKAPDEVVTEEHPLLFKPFVYSDFMKFVRSSEGTVENPLMVYAGV